MTAPIPLAETILVAIALAAGSWGGRYLYLRRTHRRALTRARALAERLRRPTQTLLEVEKQAAALQELIQLADAGAAVQAARELLPELRADVRGAALEVLRKTRALERWTHDLQAGPPAVRLRAIEALGEVGDERAIDSLIEVLGDEDAEAAEAVGRAVLIRDRDYASERLANALSSRLPRQAEAAARVLAQLGAEGVEPFLTQLTARRPAARRLAVEGLRTLGEASAAPAVQALLETDPDPAVRLAALETLVQLAPIASGPALRQCVRHDPDPQVRARACLRLADGIGLGAADFLLERLAEYQTFSLTTGEDGSQVEGLDSGETAVLAALITGLKLLGVPEERLARARQAQAPAHPRIEEEETPRREPSACVAALEAYDPAHRAEAVRELSLLGPGVTDALHPSLTDPDPLVRAEAARALGRLGLRRSVPALAARLQDPDQDVRLAATAAIRAIVTREAAREVPG